MKWSGHPKIIPSVVLTIDGSGVFYKYLWKFEFKKVKKNRNGLRLLSDPEYIDIVYICLHVNYLNKILFKPR